MHALRQGQPGIAQHADHEADDEERNPDRGHSAARFGTSRQPEAQAQQERRQQQDTDELGHYRRLGSLRVHGLAGGDHLGDLVQCRAGEYAETVAVAEERRHEREQPGVEQHAQGTEEHHAGDGDGDLVIAPFHHPGAGQDRRRTADGMTGTDQDGGFALQAQDPRAQPDRQADGGKDQHGVDDEGLHTQRLHLLDRQAQAVERHTEAQHRLLAELQAGTEQLVDALGRQVACQQPQQHGQRQRAEARALQGRRGRQPERQAGQQETGSHPGEEEERRTFGATQD
ncbi:hypothetical protein D3C84_570080 [compost metagenome]